MDINAVILTLIAELKTEVLELRQENESLRAQLPTGQEEASGVPGQR